MYKQFKPIGSNIDLKGIVIHQIIKEAGSRVVTLKQATKPIEISEKECKFIGKLNKSYYNKSNPIYGIFGNEDPIFRECLNCYLLDNNFYTFTINATNHYKKKLEATIAATGGFLIFSHFTNTDNRNDYMLVLTINNKDGYTVSETDLTIMDVKNLELSKVDVASMINLTRWDNINKGKDTDSQTYLSFVKGNKDVSFYFMSFIDCDNKTTSTESTNRLIRAIESYCNENNFDRETKIRKRNEIFQYCETCITQKKEIQLSSISALINIEHPDEFKIFAADEKYGVSSIISGDKSKMRTMKFVTYKDKKITVEFDCNLLGKDVFYDSKKQELTIKNLPERLINQIPQ